MLTNQCDTVKFHKSDRSVILKYIETVSRVFMAKNYLFNFAGINFLFLNNYTSRRVMLLNLLFKCRSNVVLNKETGKNSFPFAIL